MWAYATATLRNAWRSPVCWALAAIGAFVGWFAVTAAVLALDELGGQSLPLTSSTSQLVGILLTLWLVGRALDEDRTSGFAAAADATSPGHRGRLLGRWAGAAIAGAALALVTASLIVLTSHAEWPGELYLLSTSIQACALVGAWAVLVATAWRSGGAPLAVFLLWIVGHLPWGSAPFLEGAPGRTLAAWLPGPRSAGGMESLGYTSAAVGGLLLVALALSRPADA